MDQSHDRGAAEGTGGKGWGMSMDRCCWCSDLVDTDDEPEAYVELPTHKEVMPNTTGPRSLPGDNATPLASPPARGAVAFETICLCAKCRDRFYERYGEPE